VKNAVVSKGEARISNLARKRVIVSVIKLIALSSHSGMSHDNIAVIMQAQMYFMSGKRTLVNRQLAIVVKGIASCVSFSLLAFIGKNTKQLFTLLRIKGMVVVY
jgi:hypothetical protein